jgi:hypothetical protein
MEPVVLAEVLKETAAVAVQQLSLQVQMAVSALPVVLLVVMAAVVVVVLTLQLPPMPGLAIMAALVVVRWITPLNLDQLAALVGHLVAVAVVVVIT